MQIQILTLDEVVDILEHKRQTITLIKESTDAIVYQIENSSGKGILINTSGESFLVFI